MNMSKYNEIVGRNIKNIRESRNINHKIFSDILSVSTDTLKRIEAGDEEIDDYVDIYRITCMREKFGEDIINELFKDVGKLSGVTEASCALEESIIKSIRNMPSEKHKEFFAWFCELIANGTCNLRI